MKANEKNLKCGFAAMVIAILFCGCAGSYSMAQSPSTDPVTYQEFYDNLSPYGILM